LRGSFYCKQEASGIGGKAEGLERHSSIVGEGDGSVGEGGHAAKAVLATQGTKHYSSAKIITLLIIFSHQAAPLTRSQAAVPTSNQAVKQFPMPESLSGSFAIQPAAYEVGGGREEGVEGDRRLVRKRDLAGGKEGTCRAPQGTNHHS
jgi:hypothetical protein